MPRDDLLKTSPRTSVLTPIHAIHTRARARHIAAAAQCLTYIARATVAGSPLTSENATRCKAIFCVALLQPTAMLLCRSDCHDNKVCASWRFDATANAMQKRKMQNPDYCGSPLPSSVANAQK
jgi:hypothetical protein